MSMLVGVRGQSRESEGAALREGIIQQPGPFYNGNPSSIIWGNSPTAPPWRDESASYSPSSSSLSVQQQRVQQEEKEKEGGMVAGEGRVASRGRRHVPRNHLPRNPNPTTPVSSPFAFGFPPSSGPASSSATGFVHSGIPVVGPSFVAFGAGGNLKADGPGMSASAPDTRPGTVPSGQDERMEDIEEVTPAMANLSVNEQKGGAKISGEIDEPIASTGVAHDVSTSEASGSDVSEKFSALGLNGSSETLSDRIDVSPFFIFGAKTSSVAVGGGPQKPTVVPAAAVALRPRAMKAKRSVSAAKGKGLAAGNGALSSPSPKGLDGSPSVTGECSSSSPSFGLSPTQQAKDTIKDAPSQSLASSPPVPTSSDSLSEGAREPWPQKIGSSESWDLNAVFVDVSKDSGHAGESGPMSKIPNVAEKIFNSKEFEQATVKGCNIVLPPAFSRVASSKGSTDESRFSSTSLNVSFASLTFSDPLSKDTGGKHGFAPGLTDVKAHFQPVEDLSSGFARKCDIGSAGISPDKATAEDNVRFGNSGISNTYTMGPSETEARVRSGLPSGFRHFNNTTVKEAGSILQSSSSAPNDTVGISKVAKQSGVETLKPSFDGFVSVPPEPFVFGASWSQQSSKNPGTASPSTPFQFGAKANPPSASLSSSTGGGCVSRSGSISVSDLLGFKQKSSSKDDGNFAAQVDTDGVTSSFSSFDLGPRNSTMIADNARSDDGPASSSRTMPSATPSFASGANVSADSVAGDRSSSSYISAASHFIFSAGSGSTATQAPSPGVSGFQTSSGAAAPALEKQPQDATFLPGGLVGSDPVETQKTLQPPRTNSSSSFEFRASSVPSTGGAARKKGSKTQPNISRRQSRSSAALKEKKSAAGSSVNFSGVTGQTSIPDEAGSPMDFSPQRFTPPESYETAPDLEQTTKAWSRRSQSSEKEGADGDDEWAQYSETDVAIENLRTAASNLTLGSKHGVQVGRGVWAGIEKGEDESFWWAGKENSPGISAGRNGKWKRAAFDDNQTPLSGRDNTWTDIKMDNVNECDSAASSSTPSVDSSASGSGWGQFTFTAGSSPNSSSTTSIPRRHARRIPRDKPTLGSADSSKSIKNQSESIPTVHVEVEQVTMGNVSATGFTSTTQGANFSFETRINNLGEADKQVPVNSASVISEQIKAPSVIFPLRRNSWSTELSTTMGTLPRADGVGPSSPKTAVAAATEQVCERWRRRGNQAYANGDFPKAEEYYSRGASSVPPDETSQSCIRASMLCYSNRAATRMVVGRMREALGDCMRAMAVDPNFLRVRLRSASCHLALGEIDAAVLAFTECLRRAKEDDQPDSKVSSEASEGLRKAMQVKEYLDRASEILENWGSGDTTTALRLLNEALLTSPHSERALELKACALLSLRRYDEAVQLCEQSLASAERNQPPSGVESSLQQEAPGNNVGDTARHLGVSPLKIWRWQVTAKAKFHLGRLEEALELLQKLEEVTTTIASDKSSIPGGSPSADPSSVSIASIRDLLRHKAAGNEAFQAGKHTEAVEHYTAALACNGDSRPFNAVCLCNRAAASQALGHIGDAIADCSRAIALDPKYAKAISRRATLHEKVRDYGQCCHDLQRLITLLEGQQQHVRVAQVGPARLGRSPTSSQDLRQARERLAKAEDEMKKGHPLDHYMILGLEPACSSTEIKKAYKKAALRHHPDKAGQFLARSEGGDDGGLWKEVGDEVRREAERLFKLIGEAYAILSDPQKRLRYDQDEDIRKLRTRAGGATGLSEIYRHTDRGAAAGRKPRDRWDSWTGGHANGQHQRWQSGPDAAQPDTFARRGSGRDGSNNSSRNTGEGGRWAEYVWDDV